MTQHQDRCTSRGCKVSLTGRTVIVDRDRNRYCKEHGEHLPPYIRRARHAKTGRPTDA
jgi:hypothetical protein